MLKKIFEYGIYLIKIAFLLPFAYIVPLYFIGILITLIFRPCLKKSKRHLFIFSHRFALNNSLYLSLDIASYGTTSTISSCALAGLTGGLAGGVFSSGISGIVSSTGVTVVCPGGGN